MRKNILLTLNNVTSQWPELTDSEAIYKTVYQTLHEALQKDSIVLYQKLELHQRGKTHLHVFIRLQKGISKNTLVDFFRNLFPQFKGHELNVTGVRRIAKTTEYICKEEGYPL